MTGLAKGLPTAAKKHPVHLEEILTILSKCPVGFNLILTGTEQLRFGNSPRISPRPALRSELFDASAVQSARRGVRKNFPFTSAGERTRGFNTQPELYSGDPDQNEVNVIY
ncbi:MAG TPA: hypothetical protein PLQ88_18170 [Blastocatellia bacterium]|nr:hypothetical protein [Blastocatellia bacterium]